VQFNNAGILDGAAELKIVAGATIDLVIGEGQTVDKNITVGVGGAGDLNIKGSTGLDVNVGTVLWYGPTITLSEHISHNVSTSVVNVIGGKAAMLAGHVRAGVPPTTWAEVYHDKMAGLILESVNMVYDNSGTDPMITVTNGDVLLQAASGDITVNNLTTYFTGGTGGTVFITGGDGLAATAGNSSIGGNVELTVGRYGPTSDSSPGTTRYEGLFRLQTGQGSAPWDQAWVIWRGALYVGSTQLTNAVQADLTINDSGTLADKCGRPGHVLMSRGEGLSPEWRPVGQAQAGKAYKYGTAPMPNDSYTLDSPVLNVYSTAVIQVNGTNFTLDIAQLTPLSNELDTFAEFKFYVQRDPADTADAITFNWGVGFNWNGDTPPALPTHGKCLYVWVRQIGGRLGVPSGNWDVLQTKELDGYFNVP
jgi:hypothetical protein